MDRHRPQRPAHAKILKTAVLLALTVLISCESTEPPPEVATGCDTNPGELIITELLINPLGEDVGMEYLEIMNVSDRTLLVEGMIVISGSEARPKISSVNGWTKPDIQPGERMVVSEAPPGMTGQSVSIDSLALSNTAGSVSLMCGTVQIEKVSWGEDPAAPPEGQALQRYRPSDRTAPDSTGTTTEDPADDGASPADVWCASQDTPDEDGNAGSPGRPNHPCETAGACTDGTGAESSRRPVIRPAFNDIVLTEVFSNPEGSDKFENEWIEILVLSDFDMAGLTVTHFNGPDGQSASRTFSIASEDCRPVKAGDIVIIGGGRTEGVMPLSGNQSLYNATSGTAMFEFKDSGGSVIATARHPKVPDGASVALKSTIASVTAKAALADDDPASWTVTTCRDGQAASPGVILDRCPKTGRKK
jgi:hypothetical protein